MASVVRRLLLLFMAVALVGGGAAARATGPGAPLASMPCAMAGPAMAKAPAKPAMPCAGLDGHCLSHAGCVVAAGLPARLSHVWPTSSGAATSYWSTGSKLAGVVRQPDFQPPRTA